MTVELHVERIATDDFELHWLGGFETGAEDQVVNLFGPNGCGKSTLLSILVGELAAEWTFRGRVRAPTDALFVNASGSSIFTFRSAYGSLYSHATRRGHGFHIALDRARALLQQTGHSATLLERDTFTLSDGERKIVALACGVALQPALLVVDEPTAHVHLSLRDAIISWLVDTDSGLSDVVVASHEALNRTAVRNVQLPYPASNEHAVHTVFDELMGSLWPLTGQSASSLSAERHLILSTHRGFFGRPPWKKRLDKPLLVRPGTVTMIAGANGAGKSSLLRTVGGLRRPITGVVRWGDVSIYARGSKDARADLRSNTAYRLITPLVDNDLLIAEVKCVREHAVAAHALSRAFGRHAWTERPWTLSSGQKDLLALVAAISSNRGNLNLDEPFSHMAPKWTSASFRMLARQVKAANRTCLLANHSAIGDLLTTDGECQSWSF